MAVVRGARLMAGVVARVQHAVHGLMSRVKRGKKGVVERGWLWSGTDSCGHQILLNITRRVA